MPYLRVLRHFEILQDGTRRADAAVQVLHPEALQALHAEVAEQFLVGSLFGIYPVIEFKGKVFRAEVAFEVLFPSTLEEHFLGLEVANELLHVVVSTFATEKLAGRNVEEGHAAGRTPEVHRGQEVVLLVVQHVVAHGHARRHQFGNAALHEFLGQLRVFQLVADGHALARPDQLGQIGIQCMMRKTGHLVALHAGTVVTLGQRDAQDACGNDGIVAISLVEVATAK